MSDEIQRAWIALQRVGPALRERVDARLAEANLPNLADYSILWTIERADEPIRPKDLGLLLFLERYQVSRQLDRMIDAGYVEKLNCPEDARGYLVTLTDAGRAIRRAVWRIYGPAMDEAIGKLSADEARMLTDLLNRLA
ncbi:MAG: MarR family transcriptional regulator [Hyphomonadaceae bacterium]